MMGRDSEHNAEGGQSRGEEEQASFLGQTPTHSSGLMESHVWAFRLSWAVNLALLAAKIAVYLSTGSKAVLASLADSAVDLASQVVISISQHLMSQKSDQYPIGRTRLEALGVIGCACIMSMASMEVIQYSVADLYKGFALHENINIEATLIMYITLGVGTAFKLSLYFYCLRFANVSDSVAALAEDHLNDVASNLAAIVTASIAGHVKRLWYVDPIGAVLISFVILYRWASITWEQVKKVVGFTAPPEFIEEVRVLAISHSPLLCVDCLRVYHFGARYIVEIEIILPRDMTVRESHDLSLDLQHKIEAMSQVERAFVHVDYEQRMVPEHKVERGLLVDALKRRNPRGDSLDVQMHDMGRPQMLISA